ncbi:MAG: matrixin family metalloprotease [Armatimonadota bacterium]
MHRRWLHGLLGALALILSGCGGVQQSGQQAICTDQTFVPNYVPQLDRLLRWSGFPVRVYFVKDEHYTPLRQSLTLKGFDQWVDATELKVRYQVVNEEKDAQIVVRFVPSLPPPLAGQTNFSFYTNGRLVRAEMQITTKGRSAVDIQSIAAHEFGHALGINGHSSNPADMMYATFTPNTPLQITARDLNTLKTAYCDLFWTGSRSPGVPAGEPLLRCTIRCPYQH